MLLDEETLPGMEDELEEYEEEMTNALESL